MDIGVKGRYHEGRCRGVEEKGVDEGAVDVDEDAEASGGGVCGGR
jgi:hypothetical protein